tara:strand:+ start:3270 stop:3785 length:516 start_codon:yes stop_codon:yes gene_type:complete
MADNLKIIRGISQACADLGYDGAHIVEDEEIGLKREDGNPILDSRRIDGFKVRISGPTLICSYHSECTLKEVYSGNFESDLEQTMSDITKALKKRYKSITGETLSLKEKGEVDAHVQKTSRVRVFVVATKLYEIKNLTDVINKREPSEDNLSKDFKAFLDQGGWKPSAGKD